MSSGRNIMCERTLTSFLVGLTKEVRNPWFYKCFRGLLRKQLQIMKMGKKLGVIYTF